jgi:hypothetical protein
VHNIDVGGWGERNEAYAIIKRMLANGFNDVKSEGL